LKLWGCNFETAHHLHRGTHCADSDGRNYLVFYPSVAPAEWSRQQVSISGFTEPYFDALLGISVTGRVAKIRLPEGTTVEKGQVILLPMSK
jgi:hypothetical protein